MSSIHPLRRAGVAAALATGGVVAAVAPAQAAAGDAYPFWGYTHLIDGHWITSTKGAAQVTPADGSVEGWRFALSDNTKPRLPRAVVTFDAICGSTKAQDGKKRVGVVVDPGRAADAATATTKVPTPGARCVVVDQKATGQQVLAAAGTVREGKGMVCGIEGYPATGCGAAVPAAKVSAAAKAADIPVEIPVVNAADKQAQDPAEENSSLPKIALSLGILATLVALAAVLFRQNRRRSA